MYSGTLVLKGRLYAVLGRANGEIINLGLLGERVVTTAFANFLVAQMIAETTEIGDFKYHDCGTDGTPEAVGNTTLGTPWGGARIVGTQVTGATNNIYRSVAQTVFTGAYAIVEHGLFSQAAGGTLLDRTIFAAIPVLNGDSVTWTYELTVTAGG